MSTKTVSLDEEAYEKLKARKQDGESFSQVVKRLAGERSWSEVVGILSENDADALADTIDESRSRSVRRSDRLAAKLHSMGGDDTE